MGISNNHLLDKNKYDNKQLIKFIDTEYALSVVAPLPETFSVSAGSEITSPFSSFAADGVAASGVALVGGVSSKIGVTTKKLFMGPDSQDFTVDLKFETYYSAYDEVLVPCIKLLFMATGEERGITEATTSAIKSGLKTLQDNNVIEDNDIANIIGGGSREADSLIRILTTPTPLKVIFGNVFHLHKTYISNVNVSFSNVLDADFIPMEATVSVTLTPQDPLTKTSIGHFFHDRLRASGRR